MRMLFIWLINLAVTSAAQYKYIEMPKKSTFKQKNSAEINYTPSMLPTRPGFHIYLDHRSDGTSGVLTYS